MKITQGSIKRAVTTSMIYLIAIGFGLFSLARLKLDLYPKLEFPMIAVITQYTGVGPEDMETVAYSSGRGSKSETAFTKATR